MFEVRLQISCWVLNTVVFRTRQDFAWNGGVFTWHIASSPKESTLNRTTFRKEMCCYAEINSVQNQCVVYFHSHHQQLKISLGCLVAVLLCTKLWVTGLWNCMIFFRWSPIFWRNRFSFFPSQSPNPGDKDGMLVSTHQATHSDDEENHIVVLHHHEKHVIMYIT